MLCNEFSEEPNKKSCWLYGCKLGTWNVDHPAKSEPSCPGHRLQTFGICLQFPNAVSSKHSRTQTHAKERKRAQTQLCKRAQIQRIPKGTWNDNSMKRRKISCSFGSDCWVSDSSLHGCWLGIVVVWRLLWVQTVASQCWPGGEVVISRLLPTWDPVELEHFQSRSFVAVVVSCAVWDSPTNERKRAQTSAKERFSENANKQVETTKFGYSQKYSLETQKVALKETYNSFEQFRALSCNVRSKISLHHCNGFLERHDLRWNHRSDVA